MSPFCPVMERSLHARSITTMSEPQLDIRSRCPSCKESGLIPILYGPLPDSLTPDQERGAFFWGGPVIRRDSPRWKCSRCQESFPTDAV